MKKTTEKKQTKEENLPITDIEDMGNDEMTQLLIELSDTNYWVAIKKFARSMDAHIVNSLVSLDPFKNPTDVARNQGMRNGIYNLENWIIIENKKRDKKTENS